MNLLKGTQTSGTITESVDPTRASQSVKLYECWGRSGGNTVERRTTTGTTDLRVRGKRRRIIPGPGMGLSAGNLQTEEPSGGSDDATTRLHVNGKPTRRPSRIVSRLLQQSRVAACLKQDELAQMASVQVETIRGIENHTIRFPQRRVLERLSSVLGIDLCRER